MWILSEMGWIHSYDSEAAAKGELQERVMTVRGDKQILFEVQYK